MRGIYGRGDVQAGALILSVFVSLFTLTQVVRSADDSTWSSAASVNIERVGDVTPGIFDTTPAVPCEDQDFSWKSRTGGWVSSVVTATYTHCAVAMQDAYFETGSSVQGRIRSYSSKDKTFGLSFPTLSNVSVFAVPNSTSIVVGSWAYQNYYGGTPGLHIIRDYRMTMQDTGPDSAGNKIYAPAKPFDFELRGPDGKLVPIQAGGLKFSPNGQWMVVMINYGSNVNWARINLETYEVLAFTQPVQHPYAVHNAISNDGRYIALYEPMGNFRVYDLQKCSKGADKLLSQQCAFVELYPQLKAELGASELHFRNLAFKGDRTISLYAMTKKPGNTTWKLGEYLLRYGELPTSNGYLAMGDSFSSGEGAYDYRTETDFHVDDTLYNRCHQSRSSYPYILNKTIGFEWFGSVACSGAVRKDVRYIAGPDKTAYREQSPQAKDMTDPSNTPTILRDLLPGYREQKDFIESRSPKIATLTISGNDIGFGDIVARCVHPLNNIQLDTCYNDRGSREKLANLIDQQVPKTTQLLKDLKGQSGRPDLRLYLIGYPQIIGREGKCGHNVGMNDTERQFAENLVKYLNRSIELAAANAGVRYVDAYDTFLDGENDRDYRLCGNQRNPAVNGLVLRGTTSKKPEDPYYQESYHPNLLGHSLLARTINQETEGLSWEMPEPSPPVNQVELSYRLALVGDKERLVGKSNDSYDFSAAPGFVTRGDTIDFSSKKIRADAKPGTKVTVELHSTPAKIGEGTIDVEGNIAGIVSIPLGVTPGYHEIHLLYSNFFGELVDRYRIVFVAASRDDHDGDGIPNSSDPCPVGAQSGVDDDKDGIDDACDDEYRESSGTTTGGQPDDRSTTASTGSLAAWSRSIEADRTDPSSENAVNSERGNSKQHVLSAGTDPHASLGIHDGGYARGKPLNLGELLTVTAVLAVVSGSILLGSKLFIKRLG